MGKPFRSDFEILPKVWWKKFNLFWFGAVFEFVGWRKSFEFNWISSKWRPGWKMCWLGMLLTYIALSIQGEKFSLKQFIQTLIMLFHITWSISYAAYVNGILSVSSIIQVYPMLINWWMPVLASMKNIMIPNRSKDWWKQNQGRGTGTFLLLHKSRSPTKSQMTIL